MKQTYIKNIISFGISIFCSQSFAVLELHPGQPPRTLDTEIRSEHVEVVNVNTNGGAEDIILNNLETGAIRQTTTQTQAQVNGDPFTDPLPSNSAIFVDPNLGQARFIFNNHGVVSAAASRPSNPLAPFYSPAIYMGGVSTINNHGTITGDIQIYYNYAANGLNQSVINMNGGNIDGNIFTNANFDPEIPKTGSVYINQGLNTQGFIKGLHQISVNAPSPANDPVNVRHHWQAHQINIEQDSIVNLEQNAMLQSTQPLSNHGTLSFLPNTLHGSINGNGNLILREGEYNQTGNIQGQAINLRPNSTWVVQAPHSITSNRTFSLQGTSTLRIHGGTLATNIEDDGAGTVDILGPFITTSGNHVQAANIEINRIGNNGSLTLRTGSTLRGFNQFTVHERGRVNIHGDIQGENGSRVVHRGEMIMHAGNLNAGTFTITRNSHLTLNGGSIHSRIVSNENANFLMTGGRLHNGITNTGRGVIHIQGGTVDGSVINHHHDSLLNIAGGTFHGPIQNRDGHFNITGGDFHAPITHQGGTLSLQNANIQARQGLVNHSTIILNGTSELHGDYQQRGSAILISTVNGRGDYGRLRVNGNATIDPTSTIHLTVASPRNIREGDEFEIITANQGNYSNVNISFPENAPYHFRQERSDDAEHLRLTAVRSYYLRRAATTPHAEIVANAIEEIRFTTTEPQAIQLIDVLDSTPKNDLNTALVSLVPNHTHGIFYSGLAPINASVNKVHNRLDLMRKGIDLIESGYSSGDFLDGLGSYGPLFFHNNLKQDNQVFFPGFKSATEGLGLLGDVEVADCVYLGAGLAYSKTRVRTKIDSGRNNINSAEALIYGGYIPEPFFVDLTLVAAHNSYHMKRDMIAGRIIAYSKHQGFQYSAKLRTGLDIPVKCFFITPVAFIQHTHLHQSRFTERAILTRFTAKQTTYLTQVGAGLKFSFVEPERYIPEVHALFLRDTNNPTLQVTSTFTGGGAAFTVQGPHNLYKNSINLGGSLSAIIGDGVFLSASYDYEGKKRFRSHSAALRVRWLY